MPFSEPLRTPPRRTPQGAVSPLLVLDIDGVMIDAEASFSEAVARALAQLCPELPWSLEHFRAFKRIGGFNNDYHLTAAALVLVEQDGIRDLLPELQAAEGQGGFPGLASRIRVREAEVEPLVHRHYVEATVGLERPLITLAELEGLGWNLAILTGRPPKELVHAWEVLAFRLPAICDSAPELRKPRPDGLLIWAEAFQAHQILFAGDSRDDATCLREARRLRPDLDWQFAAIGPDRERIAAEGDLRAPSLRELLNELAPSSGRGQF